MFLQGQEFINKGMAYTCMPLGACVCGTGVRGFENRSQAIVDDDNSLANAFCDDLEEALESGAIGEEEQVDPLEILKEAEQANGSRRRKRSRIRERSCTLANNGGLANSGMAGVGWLDGMAMIGV